MNIALRGLCTTMLPVRSGSDIGGVCSSIVRSILPEAVEHRKDFEMVALGENEFWDLIESARRETDGDDDALANVLISRITSRSLVEIIEFDQCFHSLSNRVYTSHLWCTAYVACGGCSDDGFEYFRAWLIGRGKKTFYAALENPESLIVELDQLKQNEGTPENEMLLYVARSAYEEKTGRKDFNDATKSAPYEPLPEMDFDWSEEDEESMRKICPKVFDMFWNDPL